MPVLQSLAKTYTTIFQPFFLRESRKKKFILTYHHVSESVGYDPFLLTVSAKNFESQLRYLKSHFTVYPLKQLLQPEVAVGVAVTFDDGNRDNFSVAAPLLEKHTIPASFFIGSAYLGLGPYWWEELTHLFSALHLPQKISLGSPSLPPHLKVLDITSPKHLRTTLYALSNFLKHTEPQLRSRIMHELKQHPALNKTAAPGGVVSLEELKKFKKHPLITIESHGWAHECFSDQTFDHQKRLVEDDLAQWKKHDFQPELFAFPYGFRDEVTPASVEVLTQTSLKGALTTYDNFIDANSNPFFVPRIHTFNLNGAEFKTFLFKQTIKRFFSNTTPKGKAVLLLCSHSGFGGLEKMALHLAQGLIRQNPLGHIKITPHFCAFDTSEEQISTAHLFEAAGVFVAKISKRPGLDFSLPFKIVHYCFRNRIRLIHAHDVGPHIYGQLASLLSFGIIKLVQTQHTHLALATNRKIRMIEKILSFFPFRRAYVSQGVHLAYQKFHLEKATDQVIENGIPFPTDDDLTLSQTIPLREGLLRSLSPELARSQHLDLEKEFWILNLARIQVNKGQLTLLDIWDNLTPAARERSRLLIVGPFESPTEQRALEDRLRRAANRERIHVIGGTLNPVEYFRLSDLFTSASILEGHPLAPLEAAFCGLPLFLSDIEGHRHLSLASTYFSLDEIPQAAKILEKLIGIPAPEQRSECKRANRVRVLPLRNQFSAETMCQKYIDLYSDGAKDSL